MLAVNSVMDVGAELAGGLKGFGHRQASLHYKTLIELYKVGYPVKYQQIVADRHLAGGEVVAYEA